MAKKLKVSSVNVVHERLLEQALAHIEEHWEKRERRFMQALEDSDKRTLTLHFDVVLDLHQAAPVVDTTLRFADKDKEGGMDVTKTFKATLTAELDDVNQGILPGTPPRVLKGGKDAAANPDPDED